MTDTTSQYFCDHAWLGGPGTQNDVLITIDNGRFTSVEVGCGRPGSAIRLEGLSLPGFANVHSHAFHRALRGRAQSGGGSFWSWREEMYQVASALTPDNYHRLARATFAEMTLAGITAVGEFHYVHHQNRGLPYSDPNELGLRLLAAAADAGLRITLLDACYLESAPGQPPQGAQRRFSDGNAGKWSERLAALSTSAPSPGSRLGAAIHSVRAVPPGAAREVAGYARAGDLQLHFHLSEQEQENFICHAAYGMTPTALLKQAGALGSKSVAVHATHLDDYDIGKLSGSGTGVCICPTTEQDLADGIGPVRRLSTEGVSLTLGSDSQAVIDPFQEMRSLEMGQRLASGVRGQWQADELLAAATEDGHRALGWPLAGRIAPGYMADLVTVSLSSVRLAGATDGQAAQMAVFGASSADVVHVINAGQVIVAEGRHRLVEDVALELRSAIAEVCR